MLKFPALLAGHLGAPFLLQSLLTPCSMQLRAAGLHMAASAGAGAAPGRGTPAPSPRAATAATPCPVSRTGGASTSQQQQPSRGTATMATVTAASTASAAPCPVSSAAFASALDAGAGLPLTWLSHWQQQEARRAARRALIDSTRGRQQQRLRQVATLLSGGGGREGVASLSGGSSSSASSMQRLPPAEQLLPNDSLDLPPLQQMSQLDELTWLASHPPEGEEAAGGGGASGAHVLLRHQRHAQEQQQQQGHNHRHHSHIIGLAGDAVGSVSPAALQGPVQLRVGSDVLSVRPLWIAVYQPEEGGEAKLFESVAPLLPDLVGRLSADIAPFCSVGGLRFITPDEAGGPWRNYFVGLVGSVAADEDDILWPNQVLHRDRILFNVRNGWDVAKFLSDPQKEDVEAHRDNLVRIAAERGYRRGWCWHMLRLRWGGATLAALGLEV